MEKGVCLFYEGVTLCQNCCCDCLEGCRNRCRSNKQECGGYAEKNPARWGSWEESLLLDITKGDTPLFKISKQLGRSLASCKSKRKQLLNNAKINYFDEV